MDSITSKTSYIIQPIGVIYTPFLTKETAPIQGFFHPESEGTIEIFPQYEEGLKDIEQFSHLHLLYSFDRSSEVEMVKLMFLDDTPHGIFSSRNPKRPNHIGMTVVSLKKREKNRLTVLGIDVLNQTPLLDIKPYVARFDSYPHASEGWFIGKGDRPKPMGRE